VWAARCSSLNSNTQAPRPSEVVNTRAIFSFAWVAGPPLATLIMSGFGNRAILVAIAAVAVLNIATTAAMFTKRSVVGPEQAESSDSVNEDPPMSRLGLAVIVIAFVALQATNAATISIMSLFVTETLNLNVVWAGIALGVAPGLEIPALLIIGRLSGRFSNLRLIASGCLVGIASSGSPTTPPWLSFPGLCFSWVCRC
jgi:MFS transporter, SET family, sugar efflux transporter